MSQYTAAIQNRTVILVNSAQATSGFEPTAEGEVDFSRNSALRICNMKDDKKYEKHDSMALCLAAPSRTCEKIKNHDFL